ncbi:MAG: ABC transporter permease, partial [Phycisphaerales bacterium JB038]
FWVLGFPLVYGLFFGAIFSFGGDGGTAAMNIAVIDEDQSTESAAFVAKLDESDALNVNQERTAAEAANAVRRGEIVASVQVREGYGGNLGFLFGGGGESSLVVHVDPARKAEAGYLQGMIMEAMFMSMRDRLMDQEWSQAQIRGQLEQIRESDDIDPLQKTILLGFMNSLDTFLGEFDPSLYNEGLDLDPANSIEFVDEERVEDESAPRQSFEITFPQAILWGILGCTSGFAITIVKERREGTFLRLRVSPLSRAHILAGKGLACFLGVAAVILLLLAIGKLAFGLRLGPPDKLALAILCVGACFVGMMMLMSVLGKTDEGVAGAGWGAFIIMAMLGGGMIPVFFMRGWLATLSQISPVRWAIYALEGATWRNFSYAEMAQPCLLLVAVGAVCYVLGAVIFSRTDR